MESQTSLNQAGDLCRPWGESIPAPGPCDRLINPALGLTDYCWGTFGALSAARYL